eukprot:TRINITY_DN13867_c3_g1_i1.p1 TRINITY_DN13867_c3_g1~~TRINITY_DN13867_c3_g1_i1.p1  ORF type:complete len:396 (-),score=57.48 TRINITY_DN13867_c3_g1_i1:33-1220(-)
MGTSEIESAYTAIALDKSCYKPGDVVKGYVEMHLAKPIKFARLDVHFFGSASAHIEEVDSEGSNETRVLLDRTVQAALIPGGELASGDHTFPFETTLDGDLPYSCTIAATMFNKGWLRIAYRVAAKMVTSTSDEGCLLRQAFLNVEAATSPTAPVAVADANEAAKSAKQEVNSLNGTNVAAAILTGGVSWLAGDGVFNSHGGFEFEGIRISSDGDDPSRIRLSGHVKNGTKQYAHLKVSVITSAFIFVQSQKVKLRMSKVDLRWYEGPSLKPGESRALDSWVDLRPARSLSSGAIPGFFEVSHHLQLRASMTQPNQSFFSYMTNTEPSVQFPVAISRNGWNAHLDWGDYDKFYEEQEYVPPAGGLRGYVASLLSPPPPQPSPETMQRPVKWRPCL